MQQILKGELQYTDNTTSGQFGRTARYSCLCDKKIKTPQTHKKNEFLWQSYKRHISFGVMATLKANIMATPVSRFLQMHCYSGKKINYAKIIFLRYLTHE